MMRGKKKDSEEPAAPPFHAVLLELTLPAAADGWYHLEKSLGTVSPRVAGPEDERASPADTAPMTSRPSLVSVDITLRMMAMRELPRPRLAVRDLYQL